MGVRPTQTECTYPDDGVRIGTQSTRCRCERQDFGKAFEQRVWPPDQWMRRDDAVLERQGGPHQSRGTCRSLQMPHVAFHRANQTRPVAPGAGGQHLHGGFQLDLVPQRSAGAMGLQIHHAARGHAGILQREADQLRLCLRVRRAQAVGAPILVDGAPQNHSVDRIMISQRIVQSLQHQHDATLATHRSVGCSREGLAAPIGGDGDGVRHRLHHLR